MRSTDFEYLKNSENKLDHHQRVAGARSPYTRGRALEHMIDIAQIPKDNLNLCYSQAGAIQTFYFVVGYSRVGGPDVVR